MDAFSIAISGLQAASTGVSVTANNVANINSKDYKAKRLDLEEQKEGGVQESQLVESQEATVPGGSNVDLATEITNLMTQSHAYQANLKVMKAQNELLGQALDVKV
jgi:flagellar basal-body rod protein FlgC